MFKKILVILLTVMLTMTTLVGCKWYTGDNPPYGLIHEDYSYHYNKGTIAVTKEKASGVTIEEVLEKSREKKSLIIPTFIDNLPVTHLGFHRFMAGDSFIESSEFCEKLYIPHTVIMVNDVDVMSKKTNFRRVAFLFDKQEGEMTKVNWDNRKIFLENFLLSYESGIELETLDEFAFLVPKMFYQEYCDVFSEIVLEKTYSYGLVNEDGAVKNCLYVANLTYKVDERIYWIDNYNDGEKIVFPEEPKKEGYKFEGWYKEKELINKWDIEEDVYSIEENAETIELYAKFDNINNKGVNSLGRYCKAY